MTNQQPQQPQTPNLSVCEQKCGPKPKMHWIHWFWILLGPIGWMILIFMIFATKKKVAIWQQCMMQCQAMTANGQNPNAIPEFKHPKYGEPVNDQTNIYNYTEFHNQKVREKKGIKDTNTTSTQNTNQYSGSYWDQPEEVKSVEVEVDDSNK